MGLKKGGGELIHHHAAVLAIGDLGHDRGHGGAAQRLPAQPQGLIAGLHLAHQLGVGALGLDQGGDAHLLAAGVAGHQLIRPVFLLLAQAGAIGVLHAVLLHQQPAVAALPQGLHQLEQGVGMVGQGHLRRREPFHPLQGRVAKQSGEMMLPGQDLQLQIGDRRGGRHRMAPEGAEPLHMGLNRGIGGEESQGIKNVAAAHLLETPEQIAGVIEHDARIAALVDQLGNQLRQASVAVGEGFGVVVIALAGVLQHVLEMGDQRAISSGRNRGLVHVERAGEARVERLKLQARARQEHRRVGLHQRKDRGFAAGDRRQVVVGHRSISREASTGDACPACAPLV